MPTSDAPTPASSDKILFLSGAGLPAWIWEETAEILAPNYLTAVAPRPARQNPSLHDYARAALAAADVFGPAESFAVVAHSAAGVVAAEMLRIAPERVSALLAVSAFVPGPGQSFFTSLPFPNRAVISVMTRLLGTRPPDRAIAKTLTERLNPELTARIQRDFHVESQHLYRDRVGGYRLPRHRKYLRTLHDAEADAALQEKFSADFTHAADLHTGHLPMLEDPAALASEIEGFLGEVNR